MKETKKPAKKQTNKDEKVDKKEKAEKKQPAKKEEKEVKQPKEEKVEASSDTERAQKYMVTYDKEDKTWVVKKTGATRASKRCKTKKEAMEVAERLAENQDLNISVKKKDGKFQKRENASR